MSGGAAMIASAALPLSHEEPHHDQTEPEVPVKELSKSEDCDPIMLESSLSASSDADASTESSGSAKSATDEKQEKKKKRMGFLKFRRNGKKDTANTKKKKKKRIRSMLSRVSTAANSVKPKNILHKFQQQLHRSSSTPLLTDEEWESSESLDPCDQIHNCTNLSTIPETAPLNEPLPQFVTIEKRRSGFLGRRRTTMVLKEASSSDKSKKRSRFLSRSKKRTSKASSTTSKVDADFHPLSVRRPLPSTVVTPTAPRKARSMKTGSSTVLSFSTLSGSMPPEEERRHKRPASNDTSPSQKAIAKSNFRRRLFPVDLRRYGAVAIALFIMGALFSQQPVHANSSPRMFARQKKKKKRKGFGDDDGDEEDED
eukprot:scaffold6870_cov121-Cylindrotheca_fusiformis.AAC.16